MDDIDRIVVIEDEYDLERTAGWGPPSRQPLVVRPFERVRLPRRYHDVLGLVGLHAVAGEVFHVPLVPSKLGHTISYTRIRPRQPSPDTVHRAAGGAAAPRTRGPTVPVERLAKETSL
jgi:hypothetical protein